MTPIAAALSNDDFTDVAAYYAKLEPSGAQRARQRGLSSVAGSIRKATRMKGCPRVSRVIAPRVQAFARISKIVRAECGVS